MTKDIKEAHYVTNMCSFNPLTITVLLYNATLTMLHTHPVSRYLLSNNDIYYTCKIPTTVIYEDI